MKRLKKVITYLCIVAIAMICALNYNQIGRAHV